MKDVKSIHFIGVVASAIAPIAIMMKEKGYKVSGSDQGVYEPALSLLNDAGVEWHEGYDASRVDDVDLVIAGGGPLMADPYNPEFVRAQELDKQIEGYAYLLREFVIKEENIVVAGSYGKTTTSGIINWILEISGLNPSFMIGGKPVNFPTGVRSTDSNISCLEGDEFVAVYNYDMEPRFVHYKPKYSIISAAQWDHVNVYPTEESYVEAYKKLLGLTLENEGHIYISATGENNEILERYVGDRSKYTIYQVENNRKVTVKEPKYFAHSIIIAEGITRFAVNKEGELLEYFETSMIGKHNVENALAAISVLDDLDVSIEDIKEGLASFSGIRRRLEKIGETKNGAMVIDDFAHSPMKALGSIEALKATFPNKDLLVIYLPRISARENREELKFYRSAFDKADLVLIPKISVKKSVSKENRVHGKDIQEAIRETQPNVKYLPVESDLIEEIHKNNNENTIIAFMSAGGWGNMIEEILRS